jgi:C4-dicarboxylate-binding protein DctP
MKKVFVLWLTVGALVCCMTSNSTAKSITMKIAHAGFPGTVQDSTANLYAKEVEKLSNGAIKPKVFHSSQLGNNSQMNQGVVGGSIEALVQPPAFMAPNVPILGILQAPYLFGDVNTANEVLNQERVMNIIKKAAGQKGYELVMFFCTGMFEIATRTPVRSINDLSGKKFRTYGSDININTFKSWGASGIPLALAEVYTALQQGTVDGSDNSLEFIAAMKHYEVSPNITMTHHGLSTNSISLSKIWFDKQPGNIQHALLQAGKNVIDESAVIAERLNKAALQNMMSEVVKVYELQPG